MKAQSLHRAVPSSNLLKFLRAQSEEVPFFTNNSPACKTASLGIHHTHCATSSLALRRPPRRSIATCTPIAAVESSIFSLDAWCPSKPSKQSPDDQSAPCPYLSPKQPDTPPAQSPSALSHGFSQYLSKRHSSSAATSNSIRSFWGFSKRRPNAPVEPSDLPHLPSYIGDDPSLGRPLRLANELRLRCTELDENGNVTLVNGEFKKSELIAKYGLLPRDLRKIDSSLLPNILVRPSAILINLLHLRVLIKHNRVLVFDAYGSTDSYTQSLFMYDLEGKLRTPETRTPGSSTIGAALPYEFRALEAVLISVTSGLEAEFEGVREPVVRVLRELEEDIDRDKLRHLLIYSKKLSSFEQKARLVRDAIDDLLEADDDLADMYLSEKSTGVPRRDDDHTEIEMLLENYHKVCDEIVQVSANLVSSIRNTEEIVKAILDANRNSLMLLDLKFSIGTLGLGGGTFVAALYGMNLKNFIEESDLGFWGVSAWSTFVSVVVCAYCLKKLRRVQRVSMWGGEAGEQTRGKQGWFAVGGEHRHSREMVKLAKKERLRGVKEGQMVGGAGAESAAGGHVWGEHAPPVKKGH